jgi:hypothetical protein
MYEQVVKLLIHAVFDQHLSKEILHAFVHEFLNQTFQMTLLAKNLRKVFAQNY